MTDILKKKKKSEQYYNQKCNGDFEKVLEVKIECILGRVLYLFQTNAGCRKICVLNYL